MIEIESEGIYEIGGRKKEIVLTYTTEEFATNARMKLMREADKAVENLFK